MNSKYAFMAIESNEVTVLREYHQMEVSKFSAIDGTPAEQIAWHAERAAQLVDLEAGLA